jgi:hypothetical protein
MCCFSQPIESVESTRIFARGSRQGRQFVVYSMKLVADQDLAMILPLPVAKESGEDAVKFINLEKYEKFFTDLQLGFPRPAAGGLSRSNAPLTDSPLVVYDVGSFEASYVPTVNDFMRLDARFRLPTEVWQGLPETKDCGFAVFKLKSGKRDVHPMAFEFPRRKPNLLFFPTVHIHDGEVHDTAEFDHVLYCQPSETGPESLMDWTESVQPAGLFTKVDKSEGILDADHHVYRRAIKGEQENKDWFV